MKKVILAAMAAVVIFAGAEAAHAATYYTSTTGSDSNPGTQSSPFQTVAKGASALAPGDTLYIRAGTYPESFSDAIPGGTSWSAPVTIAAYPGETVIIRPTSGTFVFYFSSGTSKYIELRDLVIDGSYVSSNSVKITWSGTSNYAHHIRIKGGEVRNTKAQNGINMSAFLNAPLDAAGYNEIIGVKIHDNLAIQALGSSYSGSYGIYSSSNYNVIDGNEIYNNSGYGVHVYSGAWPIRNNIVRNNRIHDNAKNGTGKGNGIGLYSGANHEAYNNVIWGTNNSGITINYGAQNAKVYNNTVYNNVGTQSIEHYGIYNGAESSGAIIRNNIVFRHSDGEIVNAGSGATVSNNLTTDPMFANASNLDFRLQAGSPAIDAGATLPEVTRDADGNARPQGGAYDIGAYEYGAPVVAPPASDATAPSVSVTAPLAGQTISGTVTFSASASDNVGVSGVQFKVDGSNLGAEDVAAPFAIAQSVSGWSAGSHSITAVARDSAGNTRTSEPVAVTIQAASSPAPAPLPSGYVGSIRAGDMVKTLTKANVRSGSGTGAVKLGAQQANAQGAVIDGPVLGNNSFWWWRIDYSSGVDGWTADHLLRESPVQSNYPSDIGTAFKLGNYLRAAESVNVRIQPALSSKLVGTQPAGATAMLTDGPIFADGHYWWKMDYATGDDGWSSERYFNFQSLAAADPAAEQGTSHAAASNPFLASAGSALMSDAELIEKLEELRRQAVDLVARLAELLGN